MRCYDCSRQLFDFNRFLAEHPNTLDALTRQGTLQRQCRADTSFGICGGAVGNGCLNTATNTAGCGCASTVSPMNCSCGVLTNNVSCVRGVRCANAVNCGCASTASPINCSCGVATRDIGCEYEAVEENCCAASFAEFFALMPQDNLAPIAPSKDVDFPHNGACSGTSITRICGNSFSLADIGTYQIMFVVSITEAGQLMLTLNGGELLYTVAGKTTCGAQITGMAIVTTTAQNSVLTVRNPAGNPAALTVTPHAGGTRQTSAHLVITKIA